MESLDNDMEIENSSFSLFKRLGVEVAVKIKYVTENVLLTVESEGLTFDTYLIGLSRHFD
jgi:hypothetical protein